MTASASSTIDVEALVVAANANDADMPVLQPSSWMVTHTKLALGLPLAASLGGAGGLLGLGLCCLAASLWRRRRASK